MSSISVDPNQLRQYAARIGAVNTRLSALDQRLRSFYYQNRLTNVSAFVCCGLSKYKNHLRSCQSYLNDTAGDFERVEKDLRSQDPADFLPIAFRVLPWLYTDVFKDVDATHGAAVSCALGLVDILVHEHSKEYAQLEIFNIFKGSATAKSTPTILSYEDDDYFGEKDKRFKREQTKHEPKKWQKNPDEKWYSKKGTLYEAKGELSKEVSVFDPKAKGDVGWANGSAEAKILTGEVHASGSMGMYAYEKDKDGNVKRVFSPGVSADGRIGLGRVDGTDTYMLGAYGDVNVKALSAEASGKFSINKNEVYAGVSAEADLAKIEGSAGVTVLGMDAGVSGSLKVGVGAHAKAGFTDGKLKVDIGVAVGVGFDLGFELDVGAGVDAVCGTAKSIWNGGKKLWNSIFG